MQVNARPSRELDICHLTTNMKYETDSNAYLALAVMSIFGFENSIVSHVVVILSKSLFPWPSKRLYR